MRDSTGLTYLRARYLNTGVGRFITRDTWGGDYNRPLSLNWWGYVEGNPVNLVDPSGHCAMFDLDCMNAARDLYEDYGWLVVDRKSLNEVRDLQAAAKTIESWFDRHGGNGQARMRAHMAPIQIKDAGVVFTMIGAHHVFGVSVYFMDNPRQDLIIHEMGHILDNLNGSNMFASIVGGGPSDEMLIFLGMLPRLCYPRYTCARYKEYIRILKIEKPPSDYSYTGPSEDFAETFMYSVIQPSGLGPKRAAWMNKFASSLTKIHSTYNRDDVLGVFVPLECSLPDINPQP